MLGAVLCLFPGAGMVVDWEQETGLLMTSGDVRIIRIWDTDREMKVQVTPVSLTNQNSLWSVFSTIKAGEVCEVKLFRVTCSI